MFCRLATTLLFWAIKAKYSEFALTAQFTISAAMRCLGSITSHELNLITVKLDQN